MMARARQTTTEVMSQEAQPSEQQDYVQHRFHFRVNSSSARSGSVASYYSNRTDEARLEDRVGDHLTSNSQALMGIIKGNLGTGILSLPIAIKYAGLLVGSVLLPVIGVIAMHCMHILLRCSRKLSARNHVTALDYGEVAQLCVAEGPRWVRPHGNKFKFIVNVFINVTQIGFCCVYVVFIAQNMRDFINSFAPSPPAAGDTMSTTPQSSQGFSIFDLSERTYELIVVLIIAPFTFIRKMDALSWFAAIANAVTAVGLCIIFAYCLADLQPVSEFAAVGSYSTIPLAFGIAVYSFEGNTLVLPIENQMRSPRAFGGLNGVLQTGMTIVICLYTAVAFYGYLRFGDSIESSITLSMPTDFWLYLALKPLFAIAIFISYLIQFYVPSTLLSRFIETNSFLLRRTTAGWRKVLDIFLRLSLVAFTLLTAAYVPHIDLMTSLVGGLSGTPLAFTFPALFEIFTFWNDPMYHDDSPSGAAPSANPADVERDFAGETSDPAELNSSRQHLIPLSSKPSWLSKKHSWWLLVAKNSLLMLLGFTGLTIGTTTSIQKIIEAF